MNNSHSLFDYTQQKPYVASKIEQALAAVDPNNLSPKEALAELYKLKEAMQ